MSKKVFIVGGGMEYYRMFRKWGWEVVKGIEEADLVQFTGGADVTPSLYGEENTHSYCDYERDMREQAIFFNCREKNIPMAGICRGGQFLNVMSGGKMIQHVDFHTRSHLAFYKVILRYGEEVKSHPVTSTHHQMMVPSPEATLLMWAKVLGQCDTEALYYEHTKCLCFQPHPEFYNSDCDDLYFYFLEKYLFPKSE